MQSQQQFFTSLITPAVTVLGFIVNYMLTKKNFERELNKKQTDMALNKLVDTPKNILDLFDKMVSASITQDQLLDEFSNLMKTLFSYGSKDAIKILSTMQQYNYTNNKTGKCDPQRLNAYFILLVCQVKYDLTGIKITPDYWYRLKLNDFETNLEINKKLVSSNNNIVKELDLDKFLKIHN